MMLLFSGKSAIYEKISTPTGMFPSAASQYTLKLDVDDSIVKSDISLLKTMAWSCPLVLIKIGYVFVDACHS
jgi:hypothetical protein